METCGWSVGQTDRPSSPHSGDATSVSVGFLEKKGGGRTRERSFNPDNGFGYVSRLPVGVRFEVLV